MTLFIHVLFYVFMASLYCSLHSPPLLEREHCIYLVFLALQVNSQSAHFIDEYLRPAETQSVPFQHTMNNTLCQSQEDTSS